jgi:cytoskeletal protein RodZ
LRRPLADILPRRLLQGGGVIVLVIVLIFVFNQVFASNKTTSNDTQPVATHTTTATAAGAPTTSTGAATTTGGTKTSSPAQPTKTSAPAKPTAPTTKPTTKPTAKPTSKPTAKPTAKPTTAPPPPVAVKAPLLVLNNSRIHGLAEVGKATFSKGGWTVVGTGNYTGRLPETTVFYSPGFNAAAETLARQFPTITAIQPRPAGVPGSALTVVLTRYFKP